METPIVDFVNEYRKRGMSRMHMPGHKGSSFLGCESWDITEIKGADVLSEADGIIRKSEKNAASLFQTEDTVYVTEGSSLSIKMMLFTALQFFYEQHPESSQNRKKRPFVLAARNIHRAMIDSCALLDLDIVFIQGENKNTICTDNISASNLKNSLEYAEQMPIGVYVTSPDYLGTCSDIAALAAVCHKWNVPLLVDNAHGAYLAFLEKSTHPIALGADLCCDSAHKTLPVLTGGSYLHCGRRMKECFKENVGKAMALFGSTSPSYLIMQSLDLCNRYLASDYKKRLSECITRIDQCKEVLGRCGITVLETEPLKIVIDAFSVGMTGQMLAEALREAYMECEYADGQYVVLMITPENKEKDFLRLEHWAKEQAEKIAADRLARMSIEEQKKKLMQQSEFSWVVPERKCSIREAVLSLCEMVPVAVAEGRVCASETVSCPPAIPIVISGEVISKQMIRLLQRYDISSISVIKE